MIVWDDLKRAANMDKHGLDFADLTAEFFDGSTIVPARSGRSKAIRRWRGAWVTAIFAPLGSEALSVISFRPSSASEREVAR